MPGWIHRPTMWLCACTLGWCILACCILACQAGPGPGDGTPAPFDVEVLAVTTCEPERAAGPADQPRPTAGGTVGVRVRVTGHYDAGVPANYYYASLLSQDGDRFLATAEDGCRPLLSGPPLRPGESREGYVNFPLQSKKGARRLAYAPNFEHTTGAAELSARSSIAEALLP